MLGKQKCKILKEIRQRIADENDIPYVTRECTHKGECRGTCPRCEAELRYLEEQLRKRQSLGKRVAVAALCAGMAMGVSACGPEPAVPQSNVSIFQTSGTRPTAKPSPTESPIDLAGAIDWPDQPLEGEPSIEVEEGEVAGGEEEWELAGEVDCVPEDWESVDG